MSLAEDIAPHRDAVDTIFRPVFDNYQNIPSAGLPENPMDIQVPILGSPNNIEQVWTLATLFSHTQGIAQVVVEEYYGRGVSPDMIIDQSRLLRLASAVSAVHIQLNLKTIQDMRTLMLHTASRSSMRVRHYEGVKDFMASANMRLAMSGIWGVWESRHADRLVSHFGNHHGVSWKDLV
jgi:hypothetical protein